MNFRTCCGGRNKSRVRYTNNGWNIVSTGETVEVWDGRAIAEVRMYIVTTSGCVLSKTSIPRTDVFRCQSMTNRNIILKILQTISALVR